MPVCRPAGIPSTRAKQPRRGSPSGSRRPWHEPIRSCLKWRRGCAGRGDHGPTRIRHSQRAARMAAASRRGGRRGGSGSGGLAVTRLRSEPASSTGAAGSTTCSTTATVRVATSRAMVSPVQSAAEAAGRGRACATYAVTEQPEADTAAAVAAGTHPDMWIPDASVWVDDVRAKAPQAPLVARPSVASSPLVIAVPKRLATAGTTPSWAGAVAKTFPMGTADPARTPRPGWRCSAATPRWARATRPGSP